MMRQTTAPEGGESMILYRARRGRATGLVLGTAALLLLASCSSPEPKPMAQPTPDQVRGHADRGFDHLKQEERERGVQTNVPR
jgi:hypothetical protein